MTRKDLRSTRTRKARRNIMAVMGVMTVETTKTTSGRVALAAAPLLARMKEILTIP